MEMASSLLSLPPELRNAIYAEVALEIEQAAVHIDGSQRVVRLHPLSLVNKQLRDETAALLSVGLLGFVPEYRVHMNAFDCGKLSAFTDEVCRPTAKSADNERGKNQLHLTIRLGSETERSLKDLLEQTRKYVNTHKMEDFPFRFAEFLRLTKLDLIYDLSATREHPKASPHRCLQVFQDMTQYWQSIKDCHCRLPHNLGHEGRAMAIVLFRKFESGIWMLGSKLPKNLLVARHEPTRKSTRCVEKSTEMPDGPVVSVAGPEARLIVRWHSPNPEALSNRWLDAPTSWQSL